MTDRLSSIASGVSNCVAIAHRAILTCSDLVANRLDRIGVRPNAVTYVSLLFAAASGLAAALGAFYAAAASLLVSGVCDLLDGALARKSGRCTRFGALLDSTTDRISDGVPLLGLLYFYSGHGALPTTIIAVTILAAYTVSYIRARAESLSISLPRLWMRRGERIIVICVALALGPQGIPSLQIPAPFTLALVFLLALMSALASVSALIAAQRILQQQELIATDSSAREPQSIQVTASNYGDGGTPSHEPAMTIGLGQRTFIQHGK
jgi:CDP-diacylglycerol---glycerol-3-phosphate 3-phosphatidyltransferase